MESQKTRTKVKKVNANPRKPTTIDAKEMGGSSEGMLLRQDNNIGSQSTQTKSQKHACNKESGVGFWHT